MEARAGAITFPSEWAKRPRRSPMELLRERLSHRRLAIASRTQSARAHRRLPGSLPGSEHTHLLPPKAY